MYFSFFKLKKWGKKTAAARRHNCAVLPLLMAGLFGIVAVDMGVDETGAAAALAGPGRRRRQSEPGRPLLFSVYVDSSARARPIILLIRLSFTRYGC